MTFYSGGPALLLRVDLWRLHGFKRYRKDGITFERVRERHDRWDNLEHIY